MKLVSGEYHYAPEKDEEVKGGKHGQRELVVSQRRSSSSAVESLEIVASLQCVVM